MPFADPNKEREYRKLRARKYRAANVEKCRKMARDWMKNSYHNDPEARLKRLESGKKWRLANPERVALTNWKKAIRRKFGITPEQYFSMLAAQKGVCAFCHRPSIKKRLAVDHDHRAKDKRVRGLLCEGCNRLLGRIEARISLIDLYFYVNRRTALGL